jgi:hypothetical protein
MVQVSSSNGQRSCPACGMGVSGRSPNCGSCGYLILRGPPTKLDGVPPAPLGRVSRAVLVGLGIIVALFVVLGVVGSRYVDDKAEDIVQKSKTDPAEAAKLIASADEPVLMKIREIDPALEASERARRAKIETTAAASSVAHDGHLTEVQDEPLQSPASVWTERVQTYWLDQARSISTKPPSDADAYRARLETLSMQMQNLQDGDSLDLDQKQQAVRRKFASAIGSKQAVLLPILRKSYGKIMDDNLFRQNVSVEVAGRGNRTIRFIGGMFSLSSNIADMEDASYAVLRKLRFDRVEYRWNAEVGGTTFYSLKSPSDSATGVIGDDGSFTPVAVSR